MKREIFDALQAARAVKEPIAVLTWLADGGQVFFYPRRETSDLSAELQKAARAAFTKDRSSMLETPDGRIFIQIFNPPLRMLLVGAVHIAQVLAPMAELAGFRITVIDPRRAFASDLRFPDVEVSDEWPDKAMERLAPDERTAVITLTHDPKLDDPALAVALRSKAFYIGSLGSRRTHNSRLERLREQGFTDADLARIHGPLGLNLGAQSPAEIAVSALAQVIQVLRQGVAA